MESRLLPAIFIYIYLTFSSSSRTIDVKRKINISSVIIVRPLTIIRAAYIVMIKIDIRGI
jgi:hypothetical protein